MEFFDVPTKEGASSLSIFGCDSKPKGASEELAITALPDECPEPFAHSGALGIRLVPLVLFCTLYFSFSSSASFEDKPCNKTNNEFLFLFLFF